MTLLLPKLSSVHSSILVRKCVNHQNLDGCTLARELFAFVTSGDQSRCYCRDVHGGWFVRQHWDRKGALCTGHSV